MSQMHDFTYKIKSAELPETAAKSLAKLYGKMITAPVAVIYSVSLRINGEEVTSAEDIENSAGKPFYSVLEFSGKFGLRIKTDINCHFDDIKSAGGVSVIMMEINDEQAYIESYGDVVREEIPPEEIEDYEFYGAGNMCFSFMIPKNSITDSEKDDDMYSLEDIFDKEFIEQLEENNVCVEDIYSDYENANQLIFEIRIEDIMTVSKYRKIRELNGQIVKKVHEYAGSIRPHSFFGYEDIIFVNDDIMTEFIIKSDDNGYGNEKVIRYRFA